ncbi:MAG TPA: carbohydrate kinase family protein [Bacteroidales bacterium]|nr:carbohydrate kinase family protein [Bacteroidales bacterium]
MSHKETDVVVVGELNVDIILNQIEGFPAIGKEIIANTMDVVLGSSSAIFASNLSALSVKTAFIGKVGNDNFARVVIDSLNRRHVNTRQVAVSSTSSTGATVVLNYDQDRANVTYPGAMNELSMKDVDFNFIAGARHLHFSSYFLQPGIRKDICSLFQRAKELGLTTSLDTQWDPEEKWEIPLQELLPYVDVFLPNSQELQHMTKTTSIEEGIHKLKPFANLVVVKNGSDGAIGWDGKNVVSQPVFLNNHIVDCIGAGDSFNAGFIKGFISGEQFKKCLELGALTGAINTTRAGGTGAFENTELVTRIAAENFNYTFKP